MEPKKQYYTGVPQGNKVSEVQSKLKQGGYYDGTLDGVYGAKTFEAVKLFQRKNGLKVDGVVGPQTAAAMGITLTGTGPASDYQPSERRRHCQRW